MVPQSTYVQLTVLGEVPHEIRIAEAPEGRLRLIEVPRTAVPAAEQIPETKVAGVLCLIKAASATCSSVRLLACECLQEQLAAEYRASPGWSSAILISRRFAALKTPQLLALCHRLKQRLVENATYSSFTLETSPGPAPRTDEGVRSECEQLLQELVLLTEDLGHTLFAPREALCCAGDDSTYHCEARGAYARGRLHPQGFLVLKGSRGHLAGSRSPAAALQEELEHHGVLRRDAHGVQFLDNHLFSNAALAATAVLGRSSTGFFEWKHPDGLTLGEALRSELAGLT